MNHRAYLAHSLQIHNLYVRPPGGNEFERMRAIAVKCSTILAHRGVSVQLPQIVWRLLPDYAYLDKMAAASDAFGAHAYLSIHSNAAAASARGALTLFFPGSAASKALATDVERRVAAVSPFPRDGVKDIRGDASLHDLHVPKAPAALCEVGFHTNQADAVHIAKFPGLYALALADAVCDFLQVEARANGGLAIALKKDVAALAKRWKRTVPAMDFATDVVGDAAQAALRILADEAAKR